MARRRDALQKLQAIQPVDNAKRRANVAHALSLGLPELAQRPDKLGPLTIFATGPSFHLAPPGLRPALAVNGALGLLRARGEAPKFWAACDAQPLVADFLGDAPPEETTYLVGSTCDAAVFERLKDRRVILWHSGDEDRKQGYHDLIEGRDALVRMSSITLMAIQMANALGFASMDIYGWDGCMRGQVDHVSVQPADGRQIVVVRMPDGTMIPTTRTWLYELGGARGLFNLWPRDVTVHGDGLFARALGPAGFVHTPDLLARAA